MNWDKLTMAQKNELMQTYIKNGVTSLDDMKSHFNSFALGGDKDNPDNPPTSKTPTLNEYLAQRAAEEQEQYYLEGSRNRKESEYLYKKLSDEARQKLEYVTKQGNKKLLNTIRQFSDKAGIPIATAFNYLESGKYPKDWNGEYEYWYNTYNDIKTQVNNAKIDLKENKELLANCIATATSNNPNPGHYVTGNQTFRANPAKYGWKEVSKDEINPGGLIQMIEAGTPTHAVILDSKEGNEMYGNYSPGDYPSYKKHSILRSSFWPERYYYNFVGNSADSTRWINEYEQLYGKHKLGGYLFATGGPKDPPNKQKMGWFARASINAAMADNPAYMQAIGWTQDKEGNYHQDPTTEGAKELSKTLAEIGANAAVDVFGGPILEALAKYGVNQYKGYKNVIKTKKYLSNLEKARDEAVSSGFNADGTLGDTKLMEAAEKKYENLVFGENADITGLSYFKREKPNTRQIGRNAKVVYRGGRGKLPEIQKEHFDTRQEAFNELEEVRKEMPITTQDILRNANEDFNRVKSGHTVALVEDYALSKDSYPLLARIAQRRTLHNQGEIIPVIDEGNHRMIKLNKFGVNKKGKQNIDRAIEGLRETTGDKNIPDRVTILGNTYVPAFKFKKYATGGPKDPPIVLPVNSEGIPIFFNN